MMKRKAILTAALAAAMLLGMAAPACAEEIVTGATAAGYAASQSAEAPAESQADAYAADESGIKLETPTNLKWHEWRDGKTIMGAMSWKQIDNCEGRYEIVLYRNGEQIAYRTTRGMRSSTEKIYFMADIIHIQESGTYTFTVKALGADGYADSDIARSEEFVYTRPDATMGMATNIYWDEYDKTLIHFTLPENTGGAFAKLYYRATESSEWDYLCGTYKYVYDMAGGEYTLDLSEDMKRVGDYYFTVTCISYDATKAAHGAEGEPSAILPMAETVAYINQGIDDSIAALKNGEKSADEAKAYLQAQSANTLKAAMAASKDTYAKVAELEKLYAEKKGIAVTTKVDGVELGGEPSIVGAGLNATGSSVTLNIARPAQADRELDPTLRSLLEIIMELDGAKTGELDMPVCITLPVPAGASEETLRVLHYHADGTSEIIWPKLLTIDGVRMARFSLTSFSDFVFADATTGDNDNNGNTGTTDTTGVEGFVERLYSVCLGRPADDAGKADWVGQLTSYQISGTKAAYGFIFSQEFTDKNYSNADFVEHLYEAFMGRASDEGGKADWVSKLDAGTSREEVFNGFANSVEFDNICKSYGIVSKDIETFVTRLYSVCLDRQPDDAGLADWANQLRSQTISGKAAASGFVFSEEFTSKNYSNADYVEHLYAAFMGRASDEAGKADWVGKLDAGTSREEVFNGFANSAEFDNICASYGIVRG